MQCRTSRTGRGVAAAKVPPTPAGPSEEAAGSAITSGWERRRLAVSFRIEQAALPLCLERGIDTVTVEEIASAAGISRRTFYRYFDTIDDVLCASPRRSLERIFRNIVARPPGESIRRAIVNGSISAVPPPEERKLQEIASKLSRTQPTAWWRALARISPTANEVYEQAIAERLRADGKDPTPARLLAAVSISVISSVSAVSDWSGDYEPILRAFDDALQTVAEAFAD